MHQAIQDGMSHGGVTGPLVPGIDGVLAGEQVGAGTLTVIEDLEEEAVLIGFQRGHLCWA